MYIGEAKSGTKKIQLRMKEEYKSKLSYFFVHLRKVLPPASMLAGKENIFPSSALVTHFESIDLTTIEI